MRKFKIRFLTEEAIDHFISSEDIDIYEVPFELKVNEDYIVTDDIDYGYIIEKDE